MVSLANVICRTVMPLSGLALLIGCEVIRDVGEFCSAETIEVTTTADIRRPCDDWACSLWGAIAAANVCNSGMTVVLPEGGRFLHAIPPPDAGRSPTETIFPAITGRLAIRGNGATVARLRIASVPPARFFLIRRRGDLTIENLSLQGGGTDTAPGAGGAILNDGRLLLQSVEVVDNWSATYGGAIDNRGTLVVRGGGFRANRTGGCDGAGGGGIRNADGGTATINNTEFLRNKGCGGGILNAGRLEVTDSTFIENTGSATDDGAFNAGGGILNETDYRGVAIAVISGSTFTRNRAIVGAAISISGYSELTLQSSTLSGNESYCPPACIESRRGGGTGSAGVADFGSTLRLIDVTISENICDGFPDCFGGLAVLRDAGNIEISNTIIAGNAGSDCYISGSPRYVVANVSLDSDASCPGFSLHASPGLAPLSDNGGPTPTRAVMPGSPVHDAGTGCLTVDQRGMPRARTTGEPCDIGAFELQR